MPLTTMRPRDLAIRAAAGIALCGAMIGEAHAGLLDFSIIAADVPGGYVGSNDGPPSVASIPVGSVSTPPAASFNPGDLLELDLLAPSGTRFLFTPLPGTTAPETLSFLIGNSLVVPCPCTDVLILSTFTTGEALSGEVRIGGSGALAELVVQDSGDQWFAEATLSITGSQSFSELSAEWLIPPGFSRPLSSLITAVSSEAGTDGGPPPIWVSLVPASDTVTAPELASLAALGSDCWGLS